MGKGKGKGKGKDKGKVSEGEGVRVAVEGCAHGTLDAIYAAVDKSKKAMGWEDVDLLIIGGDFQATRNHADLTCMSVPPKYRTMGDFPLYYNGTKKAPYLTIFIGGNHEASSYLWELYYGGWVAPNIYYMGAANVLRFGPLRIAGLSGIDKGFDYNKPHHERLPFSPRDVKSCYHVREFDVRKLLLLREQVDICLSHDWPYGIEKCGNTAALMKEKPHFRKESHDGTLGSLSAGYIMDRLRPPYWFSAHLHCKFAAIKKYPPATKQSKAMANLKQASAAASQPRPSTDNPDEIDLDDDELAEETQGVEEPVSSAPEASSGVQDASQHPASFAAPTQPDPQLFMVNPDEIDIDVDDDPDEEIQDSEDPVSSVPQSAPSGISDALSAQHHPELSTGKPDEIDFDDDDELAEELQDTEEPESSAQQSAPSGVSDALRAQLPASFAALVRQRRRRDPKLNPGQPVPPSIKNTTTRFLALDKCLPGRKFLQLCTLQPAIQWHLKNYPGSPRTPSKAKGKKISYSLQYDPEWLAITRVFSPYLTIGDPSAVVPPDLGEDVYKPLIDAERAWVYENIVRAGKLAVPDNFEMTAPPLQKGRINLKETPHEYTNPQTVAFCNLVGVKNYWDATPEERQKRRENGPVRMSAGSPGGESGHASSSGHGQGVQRGRGGMGGAAPGAQLARGFHMMAASLSRRL